VTEKHENKFPQPDYYRGTPEGSREFGRLIDRSMTYRERLQWLEDTETLFLRMTA